MDPERAELLVRLLSRHQEELFRYIFALLPHEEDARDVLQETSVALCRKFAEIWPAFTNRRVEHRTNVLGVIRPCVPDGGHNCSALRVAV